MELVSEVGGDGGCQGGGGDCEYDERDEGVAMVKVERVMVKVRGREDGGNEKMERTR